MHAGDADAEVVLRLTRAAAVSGAALVARAAVEAGGWAVLVDPLSGPLYASDEPAAAAGAVVASGGEVPGGAVSVAVGGAVLVVGGTRARAELEAVAGAAGQLIEVRARRAEELREPELRLHQAVVRLLLEGQVDLVRRIAGGGAQCAIATVYRLAPGGGGGAAVPEEAVAAVWRAVLPAAARNGARALVARVGREVTVIVLDPAGDEGRVLALVARAAARYGLAGGVADPGPVEQLAASWAEAGQAQIRAAAGQVVPAAGLGARTLLRIIPPARLAAWAGTLLRPLDAAQRRVLETALRAPTRAAAAQMLGMTRHALRGRLAVIGRALGADLEVECVRARLLLALRAPVWEYGLPAEPVRPEQDCLAWLVDLEVAVRWARTLTGVLDPPAADALRVWMEYHGRAAPAAAALGTTRGRLERQVEQAVRVLGVDVDYPPARAEVYLALMTVAATAPGAGPLPQGAPGCGDWLTRSGIR